MKIIHTLSVETTLHIDEEIKKEIRRQLNLAIVGHEECNKINKEGVIVGKKYSKEKLKKLDEAHHHATVSHRAMVTFDITDAGDWINFRIEK